MNLAQRCALIQLQVGFLMLLTGLVLYVSNTGELIVRTIVPGQFQLTAQNERLVSYWRDVPYDIDMDVYFWNITNPSDVLNGAKARLKEVGPISYDLMVERRDVTFDVGNVSYVNHQQYRSKQDADSTLITTVNGPYMFIRQVQNQLPPWLRTLIRVYLNENNYGPFVTKPVEDLLWGYDDPFITFLNSHLPGMISVSQFGYYLNQNATSSKVYTVDNGAVDIANWMKISTFDGQRAVTAWDDPTANLISGTDSFGFAPLQFNSTHLDVFIDLICRSAQLNFSSSSFWNTRRYELPFDTFSNSTYCVGGKCPLDGVLNLTTCTGDQFGQEFPIAVTFPALIGVDPYYTDQVNLGLDVTIADRNNYATFVELDALTGLVYRGAKQMQLNVFFDTFDGDKQMLMPILWFNQTATINPSFKKTIFMRAMFPLYSLYYIHSAFFLLSFTLFVIGGPLHYKYESHPAYNELPGTDSIHSSISSDSSSSAQSELIE